MASLLRPPPAIGIEAKSCSEFRAEEVPMFILERPGRAIAATAPTNKSLAQRSKSLDTGKATKKLPRRSDPARPHCCSGPPLRRARLSWTGFRHQPNNGEESDVASFQKQFDEATGRACAAVNRSRGSAYWMRRIL